MKWAWLYSVRILRTAATINSPVRERKRINEKKKISQKNRQNYTHYLLLHLLLCLLSPSPSPSEEEEAEESLEEEEEEGRPVSLVMSTESATAARSGRFS